MAMMMKCDGGCTSTKAGTDHDGYLGKQQHMADVDMLTIPVNGGLCGDGNGLYPGDRRGGFVTAIVFKWSDQLLIVDAVG